MVQAVLIAILVAACLPGEAAMPKAHATVGDAKNVTLTFVLTGHVVATYGKPTLNARVQMGTAMATTDAQGGFLLHVVSGEESKISISAAGYAPFAVPVSISIDTDLKFELQLSTTTTVSAQLDSPA